MLSLIEQSDGKKVRTYISVKDACKLSGYREQYQVAVPPKLAQPQIEQAALRLDDEGPVRVFRDFYFLVSKHIHEGSIVPIVAQLGMR